ncbi:MAG: DNA polymerase III subunit alpha [Mycoplasma sp.]
MSSLSVDDIINLALKHKQKYVVLTDFNTMYGTIEFYNKAIANNLKPIIGLHLKYQQRDLYLIAKNNIGYRNLMRVSSLININETYDLNQFLDGCYVIASDTHNLNLKIEANQLFSLNQKQDNPIASMQVYCENENDLIYLQVLKAIGTSQLLKDIEPFNKNLVALDETQAKKVFSQVALDNLEHVLSNCFWKIEFNKNNFIPEYNPKVSSDLTLQTWCKTELEKMKLSSQEKITYIKRLKHELDVISKMGFSDYFLIVSDYVNFAKSNGIVVGPGRGSAAGSLVSYLIGITMVDPIKYNLIFERFLNPERTSMPDIDVDFLDSRRNEVVDYLVNKYGKNKVAHIITFQRIRAKMAIRDIGRILNIPLGEISKINDLLNDDNLDNEENSSPKLKTYKEQYPELFKFANKVFNFPRQIGLHAAGIVLSRVDLTNVCPVIMASDGHWCTQFSMEYLEPLGLIKMDILGLSNLATVDLAIKHILHRHNKALSLENIDLNDTKVFNHIAKGNTVGIFQLESAGMTNLIKRVIPKSIEDISICSSLYRPGPQKSIDKYLQNRKNPNSVHYLNNDVKEILSSTYNIIIYQEQVIQIVQKIAGFSLAQADLFRRAISKKKVDRFSELKQDFINGGIKQGYDEVTVNKIFDTIFEFANYGFNHSHSLAYSYISYWLAYIAYHYPTEFFFSLLANHDPNSSTVTFYVNEAKRQGVKILPPDINASDAGYTIEDHAIRFGLSAIKGIGLAFCEKIIKIRNKQPKKQFNSYLEAISEITDKGTTNVSLMEVLIASGCLDSLLKDKSRFWLLNNFDKVLRNVKSRSGSIDENYDNTEPTEKALSELKTRQEKLIAVNFDLDPIIKKKSNLTYKENKLLTIKEINESFEGFYYAYVKVIGIRTLKDKHGRSMAFVKFGDETGEMNLPCFSHSYANISELLKKDSFLIVTINKKDNNQMHLVKAREGE